MTTDHNEAMRLADELVAPIGTQTSYQTAHEAAALIRKQAERIAELELQPAFAQMTSDLAVKLADTEAERDTLRVEVERLRVEATAARENGFRDGYEQRHAEVLGALA